MVPIDSETFFLKVCYEGLGHCYRAPARQSGDPGTCWRPTNRPRGARSFWGHVQTVLLPWVFFWGRGSIALVRFAKSSMTQGCSALLEFYDNFPRFPQLISWWLSGSSGLLVISTFCSYYRNSAFWNACVYLVLSESHNSPQRRTECMSLSLLEKWGISDAGRFQGLSKVTWRTVMKRPGAAGLEASGLAVYCFLSLLTNE